MAKDPIVEAAQFILAIQTIVSRENSPFDPAVVTVGSIHGGTRYNIIPDEVHLQLTIRTYKEEVRQHILAALERMAQGIAAADGIPASRAPDCDHQRQRVHAGDLQRPATDRCAWRRFSRRHWGRKTLRNCPRSWPARIFAVSAWRITKSRFASSRLGAVDPAKLAESRRTGVPLPGLHSSLWAPVPEPTLRTGVKSMTSAVLELMKK